MTGPYLHIGLHDPDRDTDALRAAARTYLLVAGADVEPDGARHRVGPGTALTGDGRHAWLEAVPGGAGDGGLVQLVAELGELEFEPPAAWRDLLLAALDLAAGVRPLIATVAVEEPPDALPDPSWQAASGLLGAGWVDLPRLSNVRRLRFERLGTSGLAVPYGGGLAWGLTAVVDPADAARAAAIAPWMSAAAAYEAWTGRAADPAPDLPPPADDDDPAAPTPQVWWWSQGEDADAVRDRVAAAAPASDARVDLSGDPGWQAVIADLGRGDAAGALDLLRATVASVKPSWAAVQPTGGLAVPGMDPDLPMTGVLVNPWVSRTWAGEDDVAALDRVLAGAHREEVADGVLWVTDPRLADVADESWADDDTRWERLVEAADLLGTIARR